MSACGTVASVGKMMMKEEASLEFYYATFYGVLKIQLMFRLFLLLLSFLNFLGVLFLLFLPSFFFFLSFFVKT